MYAYLRSRGSHPVLVAGPVVVGTSVDGPSVHWLESADAEMSVHAATAASGRAATSVAYVAPPAPVFVHGVVPASCEVRFACAALSALACVATFVGCEVTFAVVSGINAVRLAWVVYAAMSAGCVSAVAVGDGSAMTAGVAGRPSGDGAAACAGGPCVGLKDYAASERDYGAECRVSGVRAVAARPVVADACDYGRRATGFASAWTAPTIDYSLKWTCAPWLDHLDHYGGYVVARICDKENHIHERFTGI